ncbi:MAG: DUF3592 domain-containing protein [bacterium]
MQISYDTSIKSELRLLAFAIVLAIAGYLTAFLLPYLLFGHIAPYSSQATGIVLSFEETNNIFYPIIQYNIVDKPVRARSTIGSNPPPYFIGDTVNVLYNPKDPDDFMMGEIPKGLIYLMKIGGLISIIFGIILLFLSLPGIYLKKKAPYNVEVWYWWVRFMGGLLGALLFAIPASLTYFIINMLPENLRTTPNTWIIVAAFTAVGIIVDIAIIAIAIWQFRNRPRWS